MEVLLAVVDAAIGVIAERIRAAFCGLLGGLPVSRCSCACDPGAGPADGGSAMLRYAGAYGFARNCTAPLPGSKSPLHGSCRIRIHVI
jgi:hypothetical protein